MIDLYVESVHPSFEVPNYPYMCVYGYVHECENF